jgi:hypothetical protein
MMRGTVVPQTTEGCRGAEMMAVDNKSRHEFSGYTTRRA